MILFRLANEYFSPKCANVPVAHLEISKQKTESCVYFSIISLQNNLQLATFDLFCKAKTSIMNLKILFLFSFGFLWAILLAGQNLPDTLPAAATHDSSLVRPFNFKPVLPPSTVNKKVSFGLEMGTSIGLSSGNGSLFGVYVSPHVKYKVSPKFSVNFGATISNSNFISYLSPYGFENTIRFNNNITQTFLYAEGQYQVNNRLMINAKGYKEIYRFNEPQINPRALDLDGGGVAFGFQYKVTENLHFGAEIGLRKGNTPYNPYSVGSFGQPGFNNFGVSPSNGFDPW